MIGGGGAIDRGWPMHGCMCFSCNDLLHACVRLDGWFTYVRTWRENLCFTYIGVRVHGLRRLCGLHFCVYVRMYRCVYVDVDTNTYAFVHVHTYTLYVCNRCRSVCITYHAPVLAP